ncbi:MULTISPECIES: hypothetical protein [unclassified Lactococcus]|uniref:hypothetical protein n=1 Tax=unclassified Lactococcus TaxID=2643510 RepID=UPI0011C87848|nr:MULTISPECIES: hypothetical protein [unclassified Lactococcus]MQW22702.1 hypothetical protein [Lactococcus sp. dk101]TXK44709.1 hypothetical protein FVP42_03665 [Lactococcus sp. dk310]TXK50603.1 hypothetical protein FVP43_03665 [Lactococcus sp. dk322]
MTKKAIIAIKIIMFILAINPAYLFYAPANSSVISWLTYLLGAIIIFSGVSYQSEKMVYRFEKIKASMLYLLLFISLMTQFFPISFHFRVVLAVFTILVICVFILKYYNIKVNEQ